ncbi:allophanate hydrolase [Arthrobacter sp. Z4-13]
MNQSLPVRSAAPVDRVRQAYRNIRSADRPEVWIHLRPESEVLAEAEALQMRFADRDKPVLYGILVAVKDNIDVEGLPTTAACPSFAYQPKTSAEAVQRLTAAGALVLGKTNLDQFATGLVGTRSPHGPVRNAHEPEKVSGGSSSGSAVAVALGMVDAALGTDTAGSGRIPAAFNRIYSIKPTIGYVPTSGVVPACPSYDCINVFAQDLQTTGAVTAVMADAGRRTNLALPADYLLAAKAAPTVAVADPATLTDLTEDWRKAYDRAVSRARGLGWQTVVVDISELLAAGQLLYSGALVAERHAAVGAFIDQGAADLDPTVSGIISRAGEHSASDLARDQQKATGYRRRARNQLSGNDALLLPTAPFHPRMDEVQADPVGVNGRLGVYTTFLNVLDMAAVAFPSLDDPDFGLSLIGPAFTDQALLDLAARFTGTDVAAVSLVPELELAVFGAHMRGEPLNPQLEALGARFIRDITTAPDYRLLALPSTTAVTKVALVPSQDGAALDGELWRLTPHALGLLLASVSQPQSLGQIRTADGTYVCGFLTDSAVATEATDITEFGGWRSFTSPALINN